MLAGCSTGSERKPFYKKKKQLGWKSVNRCIFLDDEPLFEDEWIGILLFSIALYRTWNPLSINPTV
jgi:hypothetical protein